MDFFECRDELSALCSLMVVKRLSQGGILFFGGDKTVWQACCQCMELCTFVQSHVKREGFWKMRQRYCDGILYIVHGHNLVHYSIDYKYCREITAGLPKVMGSMDSSFKQNLPLQTWILSDLSFCKDYQSLNSSSILQNQTFK